MGTPSKLGRMAVKAQASNWGTAETTFLSTDYLEVDGVVLPELVTEALRTDSFRPTFTEPEIVAGSKAGVELTLTCKLHGWYGTAPSASPTDYHPDSLLIDNVINGDDAIVTGYTTALAAGASTTALKFTDGAATTDWEGHALLMPYNSAANRMVAWVKDIDPSTSPDSGTAWKMPGTPDASGTVYGSIVSPLTTIQPTPLTVQWLGAASSMAVRFWDGIVTKATITLAAKKQPEASITMRFLNWTVDGSGGAPAGYTYAYPQMPVCSGANGAYKSESNSTTAPNWSQVVINLEATTQDSECASSDQGADSIVVTDRRVTVEVTEPYNEDVATFSTWAAVTPGTGNAELIVVANTTPGRALAMIITKSVVLEQVNIRDRNGIIAVRRLFGCWVYSSDGGNGLGAGNTPFRIAWL